MLFSTHFEVERGSEETWFDPILDHDTNLFIDPFLIFESDLPGFEHAHDKIIDFFNEAFRLAAETRGRRRSLGFEKLLNMLMFPEVPELCLGYTRASTSGAGSGRGFSSVIAAGVLESIARGITEVRHFEEIGLLHEGIGCDRISDITANILKPELMAYTQGICDHHQIPVYEVWMRHTDFDTVYLRWKTGMVQLPRNPCDDRGVLLVPAQFLRHLPTINPEDFWDYLWDYENERLRIDFNYEVKSGVRKREIIDIARRERFLVCNYLEYVESRARPTPYDLEDDPKGLYKWEEATYEYASSHPATWFFTPTSQDEFVNLVTTIVEEFRHFVEEEEGYQLLWNDPPGGPKPEKAAQLLFAGLAKHYCRANNVDISREVETGRGPVDFKFSQGYEFRVLLDVKLASNSRFWHGLRRQIPTYLRASQISTGFFLVVVHKPKDFDKLTDIRTAVTNVGTEIGATLHVTVVDATRPKPSASRA